MGARALAAALLTSEIVSPVSGRDAKARIEAAGNAVESAARVFGNANQTKKAGELTKAESGGFCEVAH